MPSGSSLHSLKVELHCTRDRIDRYLHVLGYLAPVILSFPSIPQKRLVERLGPPAVQSDIDTVLERNVSWG